MASQGNWPIAEARQRVETEVPNLGSRTPYSQRMLLRAPLLLSEPSHGVRPAPPLIRARVNGELTLLVVDTGATETLLSTQLLKRVGVPLKSVEPGQDHLCASVPTWNSQCPIEIRIEDFTVSMRNAAAIDAPLAWELGGIGGVLCPQRLHHQAIIAMDLRARFLELLDDGPSMDMRSCPQGFQWLTLERLSAPEDLQYLLLVEGAFGAIRGLFMLNSGAWESELSGTPAHPSSASHGRGLSGEQVHGRLKMGSFHVGPAKISNVPVLQRPQPPELIGQLGLESLRHTRLELASAERVIRWQVPSGWLELPS
jgi:hypothetical protein